MGCDIHATLEYDQYYKELKAQNKRASHSWYAFAKSINIDRGYYFFTILAGVRDAGLRPIIADPRGCPSDASYEFIEELEDWKGDAHSTSYVSYPELRDWKPTNAIDIGLEFDPEENFKEQDFYKVMELLASKYGDENVRLCFFFDN